MPEFTVGSSDLGLSKAYVCVQRTYINERRGQQKAFSVFSDSPASASDC